MAPDEQPERDEPRLSEEEQKIFYEEQPYSLLWELPMLNAAHRRFQGVRMTALNTYDNLAEWFVSEK